MRAAELVGSTIRTSIGRQIPGIAIGPIVLMVTAPAPSMVMASRTSVVPQRRDLRIRYAQGLAGCRAHQWDAALAEFKSAVEAIPAGGPSMTCIERIGGFQANPPAENWDGAWQLDRKQPPGRAVRIQPKLPSILTMDEP